MRKHHGNYSLCRNEQIVFFEAYGSWNEEASVACINEINFIVNTMQYDRFAVIVDTSKLEGITPEALSIWASSLEFWFENGHRQFARVDNPSSITYKLFLSDFDNIFKSHMPFKFFSSVEDSILWMQKSNFKGFDNFKGLNNEDCIKNNI